ncbi:MAG: RHS repeat-associated core domain-containing protein [Acidobacteria bacterium]|nr:RHS repeat-associated core domain-containing protein [Acidobacteriota bacterium]
MLGSPRVITDSQGNVIARRDFKPFGEEITSNTGERTTTAKYGVSDNLRQKFTTYQRDEETGLDFAEARMYRNNHARFTAPDPLLSSASLGNPQTFNRYVYVGNNPVNVTDPLGLDWCVKKDGSDGGFVRFAGAGTACGGDERRTTRADAVNTGGVDSNGVTFRIGDTLTLHDDGRYTVNRPSNDREVANAGVQIQASSNPDTTVSAPTGEIGTTISPRQTDPDLGCPVGSDSACGSGNVALSPSLDTENNAPLGAVAGIETIAEAGQMVPGLNVPATILKSAIDLGQGEIGEAGLNTAGLIPSATSSAVGIGSSMRSTTWRTRHARSALSPARLFIPTRDLSRSS